MQALVSPGAVAEADPKSSVLIHNDETDPPVDRLDICAVPVRHILLGLTAMTP